jgi:hypothetical protein
MGIFILRKLLKKTTQLLFSPYELKHLNVYLIQKNTPILMWRATIFAMFNKSEAKFHKNTCVMKVKTVYYFLGKCCNY